MLRLRLGDPAGLFNCVNSFCWSAAGASKTDFNSEPKGADVGAPSRLPIEPECLSAASLGEGSPNTLCIRPKEPCEALLSTLPGLVTFLGVVPGGFGTVNGAPAEVADPGAGTSVIGGG